MMRSMARRITGPTRALPEVHKDWVQDDAYSSSDVYWLEYEGRRSEVRTIDGERLASGKDGSVELVLGSPVAPWIVARRKDTLFVIDARTLAEHVTVQIAASAVRKVTATDDGNLSIVDANDESHVYAVHL